MNTETRTIKVNYLARVEGEGSLFLKSRATGWSGPRCGSSSHPGSLRRFSGAAFFEAPDFTARICGICPVAYQMSSVQAMEDALGVEIPAPLEKLRRLLYLGEWLASHALHVFFLHAPDFLGYQDAIRMARDHGDLVKMGLELKKAGNALFACLGGREVHPVNVRVGGFYRAPTAKELAPVLEKLKGVREAAVFKPCAGPRTLPFPDFEPDYEFVALSHPQEYAITRDASNPAGGWTSRCRTTGNISPRCRRLTPTPCSRCGGAAGLISSAPWRRFNLNFDQLAPSAQAEARSVG